LYIQKLFILLQKEITKHQFTMTREIKFRAFDEPTNKFLATGFSIIGEVTVFSGLEIMIAENPVEGISGLDRLLNLKITQFTGMKDRNGVEIYEGDICRILYTDWPSNTDPDITIEDYLISISQVGTIVYSAPSFYISLYDDRRYCEWTNCSLHYGTHGRIEVLGNIFENKDLLPIHEDMGYPF